MDKDMIIKAAQRHHDAVQARTEAREKRNAAIEVLVKAQTDFADASFRARDAKDTLTALSLPSGTLGAGNEERLARGETYYQYETDGAYAMGLDVNLYERLLVVCELKERI